MLVARICPALGAWFIVRRFEYGGEIEIVAALQRARFFESAMSTLFTGQLPRVTRSTGKCIAGGDA